MEHYVRRNPNYKCPNCGDSVLRIERLWRDRVIGMFKTVRRFRCEHFGCGWEGRLAVTDKSPAEGERVCLDLSNEKLSRAAPPSESANIHD